jgi:hypothetical protein
MRYETNVSNGVTNIEFDRKDIEMNKMGITTLESKFRIFDMRTQHPTAGFTCLSEKAHKATVWYIHSLFYHYQCVTRNDSLLLGVYATYLKIEIFL